MSERKVSDEDLCEIFNISFLPKIQSVLKGIIDEREDKDDIAVINVQATFQIASLTDSLNCLDLLKDGKLILQFLPITKEEFEKANAPVEEAS